MESPDHLGRKAICKSSSCVIAWRKGFGLIYQRKKCPATAIITVTLECERHIGSTNVRPIFHLLFRPNIQLGKGGGKGVARVVVPTPGTRATHCHLLGPRAWLVSTPLPVLQGSRALCKPGSGLEIKKMLHISSQTQRDTSSPRARFLDIACFLRYLQAKRMKNGLEHHNQRAWGTKNGAEGGLWRGFRVAGDGG